MLPGKFHQPTDLQPPPGTGQGGAGKLQRQGNPQRAGLDLTWHFGRWQRRISPRPRIQLPLPGPLEEQGKSSEGRPWAPGGSRRPAQQDPAPLNPGESNPALPGVFPARSQSSCSVSTERKFWIDGSREGGKKSQPSAAGMGLYRGAKQGKAVPKGSANLGGFQENQTPKIPWELG